MECWFDLTYLVHEERKRRVDNFSVLVSRLLLPQQSHMTNKSQPLASTHIPHPHTHTSIYEHCVFAFHL